uniref:Cytochrome b5 n=1 Tax=Clastoptera arizonana TaxID=38151 RepID=A0A1B6CYB1_9HEMI
MATNTKPMKLYSLKEVKENNGSSTEGHNVWIIIHNSVYNVTEFLNEHPGGEEVLLEQSGKDASEAFEDVGHSTDARDMMENYKIGELIEADRTKVSNDKKEQNWTPENPEGSSSWKSWLVPIALGIFATVVYQFFLKK